jgi:hypothetical protein
MNNNKNHSGAVVVCSHVASGKFPIKFAERSKSDDEADTGWQFVCDAMPHEDVNDVRIWALDEVLELEPSLVGLLDLPPGTRLLHPHKSAEWVIISGSEG